MPLGFRSYKQFNRFERFKIAQLHMCDTLQRPTLAMIFKKL